MNAVATKTTYTPEELLALPDEKDYELVDGHLVERNVEHAVELGGGRTSLPSPELLPDECLWLGLSRGDRLPVLPRRTGQGPQGRCLVHPQRASACECLDRRLFIDPARPGGRGDLTERHGLGSRPEGGRMAGRGGAARLGRPSGGTRSARPSRQRPGELAPRWRRSSRARRSCPASAAASPRSFRPGPRPRAPGTALRETLFYASRVSAQGVDGTTAGAEDSRRGAEADVRNCRIYGGSRGERDPGRRAAPAGVSRLRQRRGRDARPRAAGGAQAGRARAEPGGGARRRTGGGASAGSAIPAGQRTGRRATATPTPTSAAGTGGRALPWCTTA